ncbi:MAG: hypothetical protein ACYC69_06980 [Thermodesulfovibrionales bacterium]
MKTATRQANFLLPEELLDELKRSVAKREQSKVVAEALRKELKRLKLKRVLEESFGTWHDPDHPELARGVEACVRKTRRSSRAARQSPASL